MVIFHSYVSLPEGKSMDVFMIPSEIRCYIFSLKIAQVVDKYSLKMVIFQFAMLVSQRV